jgi:hypothetical protein
MQWTHEMPRNIPFPIELLVGQAGLLAVAPSLAGSARTSLGHLPTLCSYASRIRKASSGSSRRLRLVSGLLSNRRLLALHRDAIMAQKLRGDLHHFSDF